MNGRLCDGITDMLFVGEFSWYPKKGEANMRRNIKNIFLIAILIYLSVTPAAFGVIILDADLLITNVVLGEGSSAGPTGCDINISVYENLGSIALQDINLTADGSSLKITNIDSAEWNGYVFQISAYGSFDSGIPIFGEYSVSVKNSQSFYLGELT